MESIFGLVLSDSCKYYKGLMPFLPFLLIGRGLQE